MRVRVTNRGVVEDLIGYTLNLGWKSTIDETKFGLDAFTAVDITKGVFELAYTAGMLTNTGTLKAALQIVPTVGEPIESNNFVITVVKSAIDAEAIQSETSFTALAMALVDVNAWNATISGKVIDWEADMEATKQTYITTMNDVEATYPIELNSVKSQLADVAEQLSATNQPVVDIGNYFSADNTNAALQELGAHKASTENPHGVTKTQVGIDASGLWVENDNGEKTYMRKGGISFVNKYAEDTGLIGMGYNTSDNTINGMLIGADYQKQMTFGRKATAETVSYTPFMRLEELYDLLNFYVPIELNNYLEMNSNTIWNVGEIYGGGKIRLTTNNSGTQGSIIYNASNQMLLLGSVAGVSMGILNGDGVTTTGKFEVRTGENISFQNLNMNGNTVINQSDIRLKKNVVDASIDPISVIEKMRFIEFEWDATNPYNDKKPTGEQFGMEAQYAPFLAVKDQGSNYLSIDMGKQVNINSMALQRMISEIKTLKEENAETKKELADLKQLLIDRGVI